MTYDSDEKWQQRSREHCESPQPGPLSISANRAPRGNASGSPQRRKSFHAFVSCFLVLCSTDGTITEVLNLASDSSRKCKFFFNMLRDARLSNILLKSWLMVACSLKMPGKWDISLFKKKVHIYTYSLPSRVLLRSKHFLNNEGNVFH